MSGVTVFSPHRDDAAFSLFEFLSLARCIPCRLTVINFFTVSSYAPLAAVTEARAASAIRQREDHRVLSAIDARLQIRDEGFVDAPLRLGIPASQVCSQDSSDKVFPADFLSELELRMRTSAQELVLAPLSLGDHIDHRSVHRAALNSVPANRLAFYEDLPYATWTDPGKLIAKVRKAEQHVNRRLKRFPVRVFGTARRKKRTIEQYSSQITPQEATAIALWGEHIWVPAHGRVWSRLLANLPKSFCKGPLAVDPHGS